MADFFIEGFSVLVLFVSEDAVFLLFLLSYLIVFFIHLKCGRGKIAGIIYLSLFLLESSFFIAKFEINGFAFMCLFGSFLSLLYLSATVFEISGKKPREKSLAEKKDELRFTINKNNSKIFGRQFNSLHSATGINLETKENKAGYADFDLNEAEKDLTTADFVFAEKMADKLSYAPLSAGEAETLEYCKKVFSENKNGNFSKESLSDAVSKIIRLLSKYKL